jgi:hypothetical protein
MSAETFLPGTTEFRNPPFIPLYERRKEGDSRDQKG